VRFILAVLFAAASPLRAGVLEGKVLVSGSIPKLKIHKAYNPYGYASGDKPAAPVAERPKHLLVYLENVSGNFKPAEKAPVLGQKDKQFTEDIIPVISGGKVEITNQDTVFHHIRSSTKPWAFNLSKKGPGESVSVAFAPTKAEKGGVVPIYCDIHSGMRAHVVVLENPYYCILPEAGGKFTIKNVPPGTYTLNAFHPTLKFEPIKVSVGKASKPLTLTMIGEK
jgi:plastocyanin